MTQNVMPNKPFPFGIPGKEKNQMQENIPTAIPSSWKEQTKRDVTNKQEIFSHLAWAVKTFRRCDQIIFDSFA